MVKGRPVPTAAGGAGLNKAERNRVMQTGAGVAANVKGEQVKQEDALIVSWMDSGRYGGFKMKSK